MNHKKEITLSFIGFGELAQGLAKGLKSEGLNDIRTFDKAMADGADGSERMKSAAEELGVKMMPSLEALLDGADVVFSTVTPAAAVAVGKAAAGYLKPGQIYADLNSCTPGYKKLSRAEVAKSGADYLDVGVVGGISIQGHRIPCLICGERGDKLIELMAPYGMNMTPVQGEIGTAALIKMLRSVVLKGIEALMLEMFMAALPYGLEDTMMDSIATTFNRGDFEKYSDMLMATHGLHAVRRCDETEMILDTIKETGVNPFVTQGIFNFFKHSAGLDLAGHFKGVKPDGYKAVAKAINDLSK